MSRIEINQLALLFAVRRVFASPPKDMCQGSVTQELWHALTGEADERRHTEQLLIQIFSERELQYDTPDGAEHRDEHSTVDILELIEEHARRARRMAGVNSSEKTERRLIQVAALAIAAVESSRRERGVTRLNAVAERTTEAAP